MDDLISRQITQKLFGKALTYQEQQGKLTWTTSEVKQWIADFIEDLSSAQTEIIWCKDCKFWNSGSCECHEIVVNCQDYMVGDIETEVEHFCGYAEKKEMKE